MHPAVALFFVVIILLIVYLIFAGSSDSKFISSVTTAETVCSTAITSQSDVDFSAAVTAITAAKTARSTSLNQYIDKPIPPEVAEASKKLETLSCGQYEVEKEAISAISTAIAACDAAKLAPTAENVRTAQIAKLTADKLINTAYSKTIITKALKAAALLYAASDCKTINTTNVSPPPDIQTPAPLPRETEAEMLARALAAREASKFTVEGYSQADDNLKIFRGSNLIPYDGVAGLVPGNWQDPGHWIIRDVYPGDKIYFKVDNSGGGPGGFVAKWITSSGKVFITNTTTFPKTTDGSTTIHHPYEWATNAYFTNAGARWIWSDKQDNNPRMWEWTASN